MKNFITDNYIQQIKTLLDNDNLIDKNLFKNEDCLEYILLNIALRVIFVLFFV